MEHLLELTLGLAVFATIFWVVTHIPVSPPVKRGTQVVDSLVEPKSRVPGHLASTNNGLVKCSVAKPNVPLYMRSDALHHRALELAASVHLGKRAIAAHMEAQRLGVCTLDCRIRAIIAGVVRDRKTLKKLEYDQPF